MAKKYQIEPPQLGIYITPETREAIKETAGKRDKERIAEIEKHLHDELDKCLRMIAVHEITGKDFIIFTPERAIGKTRALLELCVEYGALYVTEQREINFLEREAQRLGYTDLPFMTISAARGVKDPDGIKKRVRKTGKGAGEIRQHNKHYRD